MPSLKKIVELCNARVYELQYNTNAPENGYAIEIDKATDNRNVGGVA